MKTIAFAHQKGGVGKTTTVAHTAAALADDGHRVLVVDLDPQASLTKLLGVTAQATLLNTYSEHGGKSLAEVIVPVPAWGFDLVPSDISLATIEVLRRPGVEQQLRVQLERYPYQNLIVLVDAPGTLGALTTIALVAATHGVVIPTTPDWLSEEPMATVMTLAEQVRDVYQPGAALRGIIANAVRPTRDHTAGIQQLKDTFGDRYLAAIPHRAVIGDAASAGTPLAAIRTGPSAELRSHYTTLGRTLFGPGTAR